MSDYLAAQQSISMSFDWTFEVVSDQKQKFQIATSGSVDMTRPDKIHTTRKTGFSDTETMFDGKTVSILVRARTSMSRRKYPERSII